MHALKSALVCLLLISLVPAQTGTIVRRHAGARPVVRLDGSRLRAHEVDRIVEDLMRRARVPGLALAVLNRSEIIYLKAFGFRNVARRQPLTVNSVMYGASLSKSAFAYMVMQLVDEKRLNLDRPVTEYLSRPLPDYPRYADLAGDARYRKITARMLLSHTSGLSLSRSQTPDGKLSIHFEPGTRYAYSGEGINLLGFVVEQITGRGVGELMRRRVFERFEMTRTSMTWQPRFANDYADGYDPDGGQIYHSRMPRAWAAGTLDTTITDYARFLRGLLKGDGLSAHARAAMLSPQIRIYSKRQFPTLDTTVTTENDVIRLSYGLGWGLFWTPAGKAFFKEGRDAGTENHVVCFDRRKACLLVLTNSSNGHALFKELLERVLGDHFTPWVWEDYVPVPPAGASRQ
jgi:CubicO group peptidase (beta-lactamase class C family)